MKNARCVARIGMELSDYVVLTTDDTGKEPQEQIIAMMLAGIEKDNYEYIENRKEAIQHAIAIAEPGDTVILLGRGHEADYNDRGRMIACWTVKWQLKRLNCAASRKSEDFHENCSNYG